MIFRYSTKHANFWLGVQYPPKVGKSCGQGCIATVGGGGWQNPALNSNLSLDIQHSREENA